VRLGGESSADIFGENAANAVVFFLVGTNGLLAIELTRNFWHIGFDGNYAAAILVVVAIYQRQECVRRS